MTGTVQLNLLMMGEKLPRRKVYYDTGVIYVCDAEHGTALTDAKWKVQKIALTGTDLDEIRETDNYDNLATDLATVAALSFS